MKVIIQPDDLVVNKFVTVHSWKIKCMDRSYLGEPLLIKNISLPYIQVRSFRNDWNVTLDTREANFMWITKEYVEIFFEEKINTAKEWGCQRIAGEFEKFLATVEW